MDFHDEGFDLIMSTVSAKARLRLAPLEVNSPGRAAKPSPAIHRSMFDKLESIANTATTATTHINIANNRGLDK